MRKRYETQTFVSFEKQRGKDNKTSKDNEDKPSSEEGIQTLVSSKKQRG